MANDSADQQPAPESRESNDVVDPNAYLRLGMRVVGGQSKTLGTVSTLERDPATGKLLTMTVQHGLLWKTHTSVPVERVKWVNNDSVVLDITSRAFKRLPKVAPR
jgi:uncharacterized protein YrrD